jgi:hypothetical protein
MIRILMEFACEDCRLTTVEHAVTGSVVNTLLTVDIAPTR